MSAVVVVGDVMNDVVVRPLGPIEAGSDTDSAIRLSPGGSGANQAAWLGSLGVPVRFYGRVGIDDADAHAAALRRFGVEPMLTLERELPTGKIVVLLTADGERSMYTDRGANVRLGAPDLPPNLDGISHLHVSGYSMFVPPARGAVSELVRDAVRQSIPVSCDPSSESYLRRTGAELFISLTQGVSTILPNAAEARELAGCDEHTGKAAAAEALTAHYPTVVVKLGRCGALLATRGAPTVRVEAVEAPLVDTTGAGDAFCAGYLAARFRGAMPIDAVRAGLETSATAIGHLGGRPPLTDESDSGAW